ncbi:DUF4386 domain-containing protein [Paenibacillus sp. CAA11]|uniref:DUF4386 domain-containing protein n=1 Tax=Paenibacillus sp. CAA11 TaxID=1532905 RepID=UPI000D370EF9|nr:DUF4386 domain-containing protein [Paenibacillus sp. CAA11]AWB44697.1 DUF4386 domain-containing protein [Paenibacillus sp. CAA11]
MKKTARVVGVLFLLSTTAFLIGSGMMDPILHRTDILTHTDPNRTSMLAGVFLELINAVAVAGIAMLLQPILKRYNEAFAMGYFASRIMESVLLILSLIGPLVLIMLSKQSIHIGTSGDSYMQTLGHLAVQVHFMLFEIAMFVLSVGSLLFCYILYDSKLVPRWLSIIGLIGYTGLLASSCLSIAGLDIGSVLYIPGAIFEIVLPIWLIVKGLNLRSG